MGATIIEKHFTLDKSLKGPDHVHSASPMELRKLCELVNSLSNIVDGESEGISKIQKKET